MTYSSELTDSSAKLLRAQLCEGAKILGVVLDSAQTDTMIDYLKLLIKWNKAYNLTAIRDPQAMLVNHLLDSLSIQPFIPKGTHCLDVGTGAGLPGLILAIACPSTQWTLVDSLGKKIRFVEQAISELSLGNVVARQIRIETLDKSSEYDIITARAFSDMSDIIDKTHHLLKPNGMILAMKGSNPKDELQNLILRGTVHTIDVPFMDKQRSLVCLTGSTRG